jgi:hypothetical protein
VWTVIDDALLVVGEVGGGLELEAKVYVRVSLVGIEDECVCADGLLLRALFLAVQRARRCRGVVWGSLSA